MTGVERRIRGTTWPPRVALVLCASPRVGSTLLCDLLTVTGVLGHPKELFFPASEQASAAAWGTPDPERDYGTYLRAAVTNQTSPNGVFATKLMWRHARRLRDKLRHPTATAAAAELDRSAERVVAVHLRRLDVLAAAISELRAESTGEWSTTGASAGPPSAVDWDRLDQLHRAQHRAARGWSLLLARRRVPTLTLDYEHWTGDRPGTVAAVAELVGVPPPAVADDTPMRVQRDTWNGEVRAAHQRRGTPCPHCP